MNYGCHTCIVPSCCLNLYIIGTALNVLTSTANLLVHNVYPMVYTKGWANVPPGSLSVYMPRSPLYYKALSTSVNFFHQFLSNFLYSNSIQILLLSVFVRSCVRLDPFWSLLFCFCVRLGPFLSVLVSLDI